MDDGVKKQSRIDVLLSGSSDLRAQFEATMRENEEMARQVSWVITELACSIMTHRVNCTLRKKKTRHIGRRRRMMIGDHFGLNIIRYIVTHGD